MKIAIVYDWMDSWGGVERMLLVLHEMFPDAMWYTSFVDYSQADWIPDHVRNDRLKTSFMQRLPPFIRKNRILSLPFFPHAFESFDFSEYDLVISVTSSFAKAVITKPHTKHICILLTPTRWLWGMDESYTGRFSHLSKILSAPLVAYLRKWDYISSQRPDEIISISQTVSKRCQNYYHRSSKVIYPPFDLSYWEQLCNNNPESTYNSSKPYFLVVSRLVPYKKIDIVIEAFNRMPDKQLVIIGDGHLLTHLKKRANKSTAFYSSLTDQELVHWYQGARALIVPQEEDFGYVGLEAISCDCPVIAYRKGGMTEIVKEGKTGSFFEEQTSEAIQNAVEEWNSSTYNGEEQRDVLTQFLSSQFKNSLRSFINQKTKSV